MKNKILYYIIVLFTILNIIDLFTALKLGPAETNPIYNMFGSFFWIIIIKILLIIAVWYVYLANYYQNPFFYYIFIFILLEGIALLSIGIHNNIVVIRNPGLIEIASTIPTQVKVKQYFNLMKYFYAFPLIISSITFLIYWKTQKKVIYK